MPSVFITQRKAYSIEKILCVSDTLNSAKESLKSNGYEHTKWSKMDKSSLYSGVQNGWYCHSPSLVESFSILEFVVQEG